MNSSAFFRARFLVGTGVLLLALGGCGDDGSDFDVSQQIGPDPVLPEPTSELMPDMKIAEVVGWQDGTAPSVPTISSSPPTRRMLPIRGPSIRCRTATFSSFNRANPRASR